MGSNEKVKLKKYNKNMIIDKLLKLLRILWTGTFFKRDFPNFIFNVKNRCRKWMGSNEKVKL